ncbi:hypothetical protein Clacol_001644 [Clathrus columnatus]|uniref:Splicing factor Cactin n=1 Tax=Clathrus columnatus TaxID=1419009 RepID=A0AAV4ZYP5_9AGAM|nr:hypothetical protein Clacol_001644 [Clathrus columnatus]
MPRSRSRSPRAHKRQIRSGSPYEYKESRTHEKDDDRKGSRDDEKRKKRKRDKSSERKAERQRQRDEEAKQVAELNVYSALDNPFHDANLSQQFRWHKKLDKERKAGLSLTEAQQRDAIRRQEAKEELEKLNRRRAEREIEQRLRDEEEARMAKLSESAQMDEWIAKEGAFQLEQERRRAGIRLKEKRAKAIDFLVLNLKYAGGVETEDDGLELDDTGLEIDLDEPYAIFESLGLSQTEELHDDIQRYLSLETSNINVDFWTNMMVVCKDRLERLRADTRMGPEAVSAHNAVEAEIATLLSGKSHEQLVTLQKQVQLKLASREPVDTDYWEGLLKSLIVWKAKAKLKNLHEVVVRNRLEQLRKRQRDEALQAQQELLAGVARQLVDKRTLPVVESEPMKTVEKEDIEPYSRSMSPEPIPLSALGQEKDLLPILTASEDKKALFALRRKVTAARFVAKQQQVPEVVAEPVTKENDDMDAEALYKAEAERHLEEEEELFNVEADIEHPTTYTWEDKYRPRKPRYFNRVHTGYEWNKYNQTHYDTDNPPPKVVQGYKFNLFYPDLIDKSKAPTYKVIRSPDDPDTALLYFSAGPPYEDIAFKVVDREWEYSHKRFVSSPCSYNVDL